MAPKSKKRKLQQVVVEKEEDNEILTNMQRGDCRSVVSENSESVNITALATVSVGHAEALISDRQPVIDVDTSKQTCSVVMTGENSYNAKTLLLPIHSQKYKSFRINSAILLLIFKDSLAAVSRETYECLSIIDLSANIPASDSCIVMSEDDKVVIISASTTTMVPYGGSMSPAALSCQLYTCLTGDLLASYEIAFQRVAYFPSTLRAHCQGGRLMVSCWDDMQLKVVDIDSGAELYTLEKHEENESCHITTNGGLEASVKVIAVGVEYIAVGYEWQRYIKACPLRVYDIATGRRLHCLPANGASPKCLAIHDRDKLLFSTAESHKEVRVYSLELGTKLYSLPCVEKIIDFTLRNKDNTLYVRSNEVGFTCGRSVTVTLWDFSNAGKDSEKEEVEGGGRGVVIINGKVQRPFKKRASRI